MPCDHYVPEIMSSRDDPRDKLHLLDKDEIKVKAIASQERSRARTASPKDVFIAHPIKDGKVCQSTRIYEFSRAEDLEVQDFLSSKAVPQKVKEGRDEAEIRRIRSVQSHNKVTSFTFKGKDSADYLPGGAPLLDHLYNRAIFYPDWKVVLPALRKLQDHRLPCTVKPASQREITLGDTPDRHVLVALEFLRDNIKLTTRNFNTSILAADTESVGVVQSDYSKLMSGEPGTNHVLRLAMRGESADSLPVVLAVGHVGWQINFRLPTLPSRDTDGRRCLKVIPGELQESIPEVFRALGTLTGVDVMDDLRDFFRVVRRLYGVDLWEYTRVPLELDRLARLAGYNMVRYGIGALNWICFGTVLAKGQVSKGDGKWHLPWDALPMPLRVYLAGDISQCAGVAVILEYTLIVHMFPDLHAVGQLSTLDPLQLIQWWERQILPRVEPYVSITSWNPASTHEEVLQLLLGASEAGRLILKLFPPWPSPPAGGARYNHAARVFLLSCLPVLREIDPTTWPQLLPEVEHLVIFGRAEVIGQSVPTAPVHHAGWHPDPQVTGMLSGDSDSLTWRKIKGSAGNGVGAKALLLEYARIKPHFGKSLMARLESHKRNPSIVLGCREKAIRIIPSLRVMLATSDHLPHRPPGWVDPFKEAEAREAKLAKITARAADLAYAAKRKAEGQLRFHRQLKEATRSIRKKPPTVLDSTVPLMRLITPVGAAPPLTGKRLAAIGETQVPKRRRITGPETEVTGNDQANDPMALLRQSLQRDRAVNGQAKEVRIVRTVYREQRDSAELGGEPATDPRVSTHRLPQPGPQNRDSAELGGGPAAAPRVGTQWSPCPGTETPSRPANIIMVGNSHAIHAIPGLEMSLLGAPVQSVPIQGWSVEAFETAAADLSHRRLDGAYVLLWLFDEMVHIQQETGKPLDRSRYDGRLHCSGPLGVIHIRRMLRLLDDAYPLLNASRGADKVILMMPLPVYLTDSCCEDPIHCTGYYEGGAQRGICRGLTDLREVVIRYVSNLNKENYYVVAPHHELMNVAKSHRRDELEWLRDSYTFDAVHLTAEGYMDLFDRVGTVLSAEPWRYRPPAANMPELPTSPARPVTGRRARNPPSRRMVYIPPEVRVLADTLVDSGPAHITAEEERAAIRGPWRQEEERDRSPPISPSIWAAIRASAPPPPANRPAGGQPG